MNGRTVQQLTEDELRHSLWGRYGDDIDLLPLAALGIVRLAWRNDRNGEVETAHITRISGRRDRISDGEMFAANVATTRLIRDHIRPYPAVDWEALTEALIDPGRMAGRRSVVDLLGATRHQRWTRSATIFIDSIVNMIAKNGPDFALLLLAASGADYDNWWSGPRWQQLVDTFITELTEQPPGMSLDDLRIGLLDAPDELDPAILDWCTDNQLIGYTRLD